MLSPAFNRSSHLLSGTTKLSSSSLDFHASLAHPPSQCTRCSPEIVNQPLSVMIYQVWCDLPTCYTIHCKIQAEMKRCTSLANKTERSAKYHMKWKLPLSLLLLKIHKYLICSFTRAILRCYFNTKEGRKPVGNKTSREEGLTSNFHSLFPCSKSINKGL